MARSEDSRRRWARRASGWRCALFLVAAACAGEDVGDGFATPAALEVTREPVEPGAAPEEDATQVDASARQVDAAQARGETPLDGAPDPAGSGAAPLDEAVEPAPPGSEATDVAAIPERADEAREEDAMPATYRATLDDVTIQGEIDRAMLKRLFRKQRRELEACARKAAGAGEDPRGQLSLRLVLVDRPKAVLGFGITGNTSKSRRTLPTCVERAMRSWSWPTRYVCGAANLEVRLRFR